MRLLLTILISLTLSQEVTAQILAKKNCLHPTEIRLRPEGNEILSNTGIREFDKAGNVLVDYYEDNNTSKWYRIVAEYDLTLSFKIWSDNSTSKYGFFIYRNDTASFFCENLSRGMEQPVEGVIYKESIGIFGIGILPTINKDYLDTNKYDESDLLYRLPYKNAIHAKAGEEFYLNVYRYSAEDCGHFLWLTANENTSKLHCQNEFCEKVEVLNRINVKMYFDSTEHKLIKRMAILNRPKPYIANITVLDGEAGNPIKSSLYYNKDTLCTKETHITDSLGKLTLTLYKDTSFIVHKMGYHSQLIKFSRSDFNYTTVNLKKIAPGEQFILENIYFRTNSSRILTTSKPELEKLAGFLLDNLEYKIEIQGHTNGESKIRKDRNVKNSFHGNEKKLSRLRALSVKNILIEMGVANGRLKIKGLGGEEMLFPFPKSAAEHDRNKRVEIVIL